MLVRSPPNHRKMPEEGKPDLSRALHNGGRNGIPVRHQTGDMRRVSLHRHVENEAKLAPAYSLDAPQSFDGNVLNTKRFGQRDRRGLCHSSSPKPAHPESRVVGKGFSANHAFVISQVKLFAAARLLRNPMRCNCQAGFAGPVNSGDKHRTGSAGTSSPCATVAGDERTAPRGPSPAPNSARRT